MVRSCNAIFSNRMALAHAAGGNTAGGEAGVLTALNAAPTAPRSPRSDRIKGRACKQGERGVVQGGAIGRITLGAARSARRCTTPHRGCGLPRR